MRRKPKPLGVFQGNIKTRSGVLVPVFRKLIGLLKPEKAHSHARENARRRRQIARGIIRVTA